MPVPSNHLPLGTRLPWFRLTDLSGVERSASDVADGQIAIIAFICNHSPYVRHIEDELAEALNRYQREGVYVVAISPNDVVSYPSDDLDEAMLATTRDAMYGWTAERLVRSQTAQGHPSFLYYYDHSYPAADEAALHAFHASELPYVFGTYEHTPPHWPAIPGTVEDRRLSDAMMSYWLGFARDGRPVAEGQPQWRPYGEDRAYITFDGAPAPGQHLMPGMFELVETVVCRRRIQGETPWHWNVGVVSPPLPAGGPQCP